MGDMFLDPPQLPISVDNGMQGVYLKNPRCDQKHLPIVSGKCSEAWEAVHQN